PLLAMLERRFASVNLIALDEYLFEGAMVKVALLLAEGIGPGVLRLHEAREIANLDRLIEAAPAPVAAPSWVWSRIPADCRPPPRRGARAGVPRARSLVGPGDGPDRRRHGREGFLPASRRRRARAGPPGRGPENDAVDAVSDRGRLLHEGGRRRAPELGGALAAADAAEGLYRGLCGRGHLPRAGREAGAGPELQEPHPQALVFGAPPAAAAGRDARLPRQAAAALRRQRGGRPHDEQPAPGLSEGDRRRRRDLDRRFAER